MDMRTNMVLQEVDKALMKYKSDNISCDVDHNGYTFCVNWCSNNNSFLIAENICDAESVDRDLLIKELDERGVGYCW